MHPKVFHFCFRSAAALSKHNTAARSPRFPPGNLSSRQCLDGTDSTLPMPCLSASRAADELSVFLAGRSRRIDPFRRNYESR